MATEQDPIHGGKLDDRHTPQHEAVAQAWNRAKAAGKRLVVRVVAAWSEQCLVFDETLPQHAAALDEQLARVELLVLHETEFVRSHSIDFLPSDLLPLQAVYLAEPALGPASWTVISNVEDAGLLARYLAIWLDTNDFPKTLQQMTLDFDPAKSQIPFAHLVQAAAQATGYSKSFEELKGFMEKLRALRAQREELFAGVDLDTIEVRSVVNSIGVGRISFDDLPTLAPAVAERISASLSEMLETRLYFRIGNIVRKEGLRKAAEVAKTILEEVHGVMPKKAMNHIGQEDDTTGAAVKNETMVKLVEAWGGTLTLEQAEQFVEYVKSKNVDFFYFEVLPQVFLALGAYGRAADLYEQSLPEWGKYYDGLVVRLAALVEKATEEGNEAMATMLKRHIRLADKVKASAVDDRRIKVKSLREQAAASA